MMNNKKEYQRFKDRCIDGIMELIVGLESGNIRLKSIQVDRDTDEFPSPKKGMMVKNLIGRETITIVIQRKRHA